MDSHAPNKQDNAADAAQQHAIMHGAAPATAAPSRNKNVDVVDAREEVVVPALESLPLETKCPPFPLRQHAGYWLPETMLAAGVPALHARFTPRRTDVLLESFPMSGTTWLKALAFAARSRAAHPPSDGRHPLRHSNPHDCVRFLDVEFAIAGRAGADGLAEEFEALPSPRTFATHLPYSLLPERVRGCATRTGEDDDGDDGPAGCRIVYVCRDPKDTLVSSWRFTKKVAPAFGAAAADEEAFTFREAFELFCDGRAICGPQWRHVLEYWEESVRRPGKVLFLRYEEMLLAPRESLRKLAEFMGCGFSEEEEAARVVDAIVELCSLDTLRNAAVNQGGRSGKSLLPVGNETFFGKGGAGGWRNHMTPEMAKRLDEIVEHAVQGSGLTYGSSSA